MKPFYCLDWEYNLLMVCCTCSHGFAG